MSDENKEFTDQHLAIGVDNEIHSGSVLIGSNLKSERKNEIVFGHGDNNIRFTEDGQFIVNGIPVSASGQLVSDLHDMLKKILQIYPSEGDTGLLDKLTESAKGYGKGWILRESVRGRGMRLHETSQEGASRTPREAIEKYFKE